MAKLAEPNKKPHPENKRWQADDASPANIHGPAYTNLAVVDDLRRSSSGISASLSTIEPNYLLSITSINELESRLRSLRLICTEINLQVTFGAIGG